MAVSHRTNLPALFQALNQDCEDAGTKLTRLSLHRDCFPPESHFEFGFRSELTLLERACNNKVSTVKQLCECWAVLVHAYIACPTAFEEQIKSGTVSLPGIPKSGEGLEPAEAVFVSIIQVLESQLHTLKNSSTCRGTQKVAIYTDFSTLLHTQHLPLCTTLLRTFNDFKSFRDLATEIAFSYQDVEWFSRAIMLRTVLQVAVNQGSMRNEVAAQAVRHAERLIQLLPDNAASYESSSYAAMHSPGHESDLASRHMQWAIVSASHSGDNMGVAQYAMQVMYFMLWNMSMSQDKWSDADALELDLEEVMRIVQNAEVYLGWDSSLGQDMSPSCWQRVATARLLLATATVAKLAFAIPECPKQLLVYLEHLLTRVTSPETQDAQPQLMRQDKISSDAKAGVQTCSRSKAASSKGSAGKQKQRTGRLAQAPQDAPPGKKKLSGHSSNFRYDVRTSTDQSSRSSNINSTGSDSMQASSTTTQLSVLTRHT